MAKAAKATAKSPPSNTKVLGAMIDRKLAEFEARLIGENRLQPVTDGDATEFVPTKEDCLFFLIELYRLSPYQESMQGEQPGVPGGFMFCLHQVHPD